MKKVKCGIKNQWRIELSDIVSEKYIKMPDGVFYPVDVKQDVHGEVKIYCRVCCSPQFSGQGLCPFLDCENAECAGYC